VKILPRSYYLKVKKGANWREAQLFNEVLKEVCNSLKNHFYFLSQNDLVKMENNQKSGNQDKSSEQRNNPQQQGNKSQQGQTQHHDSGSKQQEQSQRSGQGQSNEWNQGDQSNWNQKSGSESEADREYREEQNQPDDSPSR
jgi:hypothetical protein